MPGFKTYAAWPVWSDSARGAVLFRPLAKKTANIWYQKARAFNRTKVERRYGGAIGSSGIRVLEALIYDFLNYKSGQLDPSYEAIARKTGLGRSTVGRALVRLKQLRILHWVRRCSAEVIDGVFELRQDTNAYAIQGPTQWLGFIDPRPAAPAPHPTTWGATPPLPDVLDQAAAHAREGTSTGFLASVLELDERNPLARALARLGRTMDAKPPKPV